MADKKEKRTAHIGWGDGHVVKIRKANLKVIPGDSVVCPMPCHPFGETADEWNKHEKETGKRPERANIE